MNHFLFREASLNDIEQIQVVRNSVNENKLSNPNVITNEACAVYLTIRGKGWICEMDKQIVGFSIADLVDHNIWALFVQPDLENHGIGKNLHDLMLNWYFNQTHDTLWLSTAPATRAVGFYKNLGWIEMGIFKNGEIKFELSFDNWITLRMKELRNERIKEFNPEGVK